MDMFKKQLFDALANAPDSVRIEEPIVMALIDYGVDIEQLHISNDMSITGRRFYQDPNKSGLTKPYYDSSQGHGALLMAKQIHRVCPTADLLVLKLEDGYDQSTTSATSRPRAPRRYDLSPIYFRMRF
jgi:hypothetical protein